MRAVKSLIPVFICSLALVVAGALAASGSVTLLSEVFAPETSRLPTVVLDPGHGGEDGGALSPGGVRESQLNLEISLRVRDLFRLLGVPVVMTRETDVSLHSPEAGTISEKKVSDLRNRVRLVGETPNALLVSVHQNMFSESKYAGAQVFYAGTAGSKALAELMQDRLRACLDPNNHRQPKESQSVYLMEHISCTGVLVECGFLSNPGEEALLQTEEYQKKLAAVIAASVTEALAQTPDT